MTLKEGTGGLLGMISCGDFMEIYKEDVTFRVKTPEGVDPGGLNPDTPWVASISDSVGSSNIAVARVLLQGVDILNSAMFTSGVDKENIIHILHTTKETIVVCDKIAKKVSGNVADIIETVKKHGISQDNRGFGLNPFPQVIDLELNATQYLIHAKRAIREICRLPSVFLGIEDKDNNFMNLSKTLEKKVGDTAPVTKFVIDNQEGVKHLIDLRNFQEHPEEKRTIIENFMLMPDLSVNVPMWHVSDQQPHPIKDEMLAGVIFLVKMAEAMLIHLVMHSITKQISYCIEEIDDAEVDPKKPIKYRLSIDSEKLILKEIKQ